MCNGTRIALIPAYEPSEPLLTLVAQLYGAGFQIVLVDDGSGEAYRSIFRTAGSLAVILTHPRNEGKGRALKTGLAYIQEHFAGHYVVVTLDADGQHSVEDAVRVCEAAERNPGTFVLGCRDFRGQVPARSLFGNQAMRIAYRLFTGTKVSDTQTGMRAFSADRIPFLLQVDGSRYEYEMNVLLTCARRNIPMKEVRIETIYRDNNKGSHFDTLKDSFRISREILKFAASSFTGFLVDYGMYSLLTVTTGGLGTAVSVPLSNVLARIVSASVNFTINKKFVFRNRDSAARTGAEYFILAACILTGNTLLLSWLVGSMGMNRFAAKIVTELTFFSLSWLVQRFLIFRNREPLRRKRTAYEK